MATPFAVLVEELEADYSEAIDNLELSTTYRIYAYDHWFANQDHEAIYDLYRANKYNHIALCKIVSGWSSSVPPPFLPTILRLCWEYDYETMPPADVTWRAICEAWIKDDFAGRMPTIAVIDRMRQILWDEPFRVLWAARPEYEI